MDRGGIANMVWWTVSITIAAIGLLILVGSLSTLSPHNPAEEISVQTQPAAIGLEKPSPPPSDFVGSAVCSECHAEIYDTYQSHPMYRSLTKVSTASPIEDYDKQSSFSPPGSRHYRVERTDEGVFHHEIMTSAEGELIYDQAVEVQYAFGSGVRGRAYLLDREGMLYMSPIGWYSERSQWDLSPGYHPEDHPRFERSVGDGCLMCHVGRMNHDHRGRDIYGNPRILEEPIGCERCHGPGARHVARHRSTEKALVEETIINPARLDPARREDVCNSCHLGADSRFLRYGRGHFDFRPGMRIEDVWTYFTTTTQSPNISSAATKAVSQVVQMRASLCYNESSQRMGCGSCHDPHSVPKSTERHSHYRSKCLQCHTEHGCSLPFSEQKKQPAAGSCIHCHMPSLAASDVPHTSQTDHRIPRVPSKARLRRSNPSHILFDGAEDRLRKLEVDRAKGLMLIGFAEKRHDVSLARKVESLLLPVVNSTHDDVSALAALGRAFHIQGRLNDTVTSWERVLEVDSRNQFVLALLGQLACETGNDEYGVRYLDRLLAINQWHADVYLKHAVMLGAASGG